MKKHGLAVIFFFVMVAMAGAIAWGVSRTVSTPGSEENPFLSLRWVRDTFVPDTAGQAMERFEETFASSAARPVLRATELRVKKGDLLTLKSGTVITPLSGVLWASPLDGATIDATDGREVRVAGEELGTMHRYIVAEDAVCLISATSDTAVLQMMGTYQMAPSREIDYNALADALKILGLFRGTNVPYGSGYELERVPTRIQGLVMFLRLMGKEEEALAFSGGGAFFPDVPDWAKAYVAYAYQQGYTKGQTLPDETGQVLFGSADPLTARDYVTFLLRALGYADGRDFHWSSAVEDARTKNILTRGEATHFVDHFYRAQVVYLSYCALQTPLAGEKVTLAAHLISQGIISEKTFLTLQESLQLQRM